MKKIPENYHKDRIVTFSRGIKRTVMFFNENEICYLLRCFWNIKKLPCLYQLLETYIGVIAVRRIMIVENENMEVLEDYPKKEEETLVITKIIIQERALIEESLGDLVIMIVIVVKVVILMTAMAMKKVSKALKVWITLKNIHNYV